MKIEVVKLKEYNSTYKRVLIVDYVPVALFKSDNKVSDAISYLQGYDVKISDGKIKKILDEIRAKHAEKTYAKAVRYVWVGEINGTDIAATETDFDKYVEMLRTSEKEKYAKAYEEYVASNYSKRYMDDKDIFRIVTFDNVMSLLKRSEEVEMIPNEAFMLPKNKKDYSKLVPLEPTV